MLSTSMRTIIIDLDGVVWRLDELVPKARETIASLRDYGYRIVFLTNNSSMSRLQVVEKFSRMNLSVSVDEILSSTNTTAIYIAHIRPNANVIVIGTPGLENEICLAGLNIVDDPLDAEFVIAGFDDMLNYKKLEKALKALLNGARFIATNDDGMLPTENGFRPGAGAVVGAISGMIKRAPEVVVGKPNDEIIRGVFKVMGIDIHSSLIVGDSLATDIHLANKLGIPSALVLTGNTRNRNEIVMSKHTPTYVLDSIADLPNLLCRDARINDKAII